MNTKSLIIIGAVVAAFTFTSHAQSGAAAQLKSQPAKTWVADNTVTTIAYVDKGNALLSPRAQGNQSKIIKGMDTNINPALVCRAKMVNSPKAVAECASHANMPGCQTATVAPLK